MLAAVRDATAGHARRASRRGGPVRRPAAGCSATTGASTAGRSSAAGLATTLPAAAAARPGGPGRLGAAVGAGAGPAAARRWPRARPWRDHRRGAAGRGRDRPVQLPADRRRGDRRHRGGRHLVLPPAGRMRCVIVASEPGDDEPGWTEVPDGSLVTATPRGQVPGHRPGRPRLAPPHPHERIAIRMSITCDRRLPPGFLAEALRADAQAGLTADPKSLPPKWFYDAQGSALFEKITELPEYYPTRAEREILHATAAGSIAAADPGADAGGARLRVLGEDPAAARRAAGRGHAALLRAGRRQRGGPDRGAADALPRSTRAWTCAPSCRTSSSTSGCPPTGDSAPAPRLVAFLGGTIGNLLPAAAGRRSWTGSGPSCAQATSSCSAPTWSRTRPRWSPPTTTLPGSPPSSTRTCWPC